ncbi:MAG TPA: hypothetical protein VJJ81_01110 [Candidatus Babeliales bacterium]|nr:hypothetical protein [Candidatus Babeliales bacterium]
MENLPKFKFKKDAYMKKRGTPIMLKISCMQCKKYLMSYQKDGPGPLLRCYLDRIHHPENLKARQYHDFIKSSAPKLNCEICKIVIGTPIVYEKENRPAYHMRPGFFMVNK